MNFFKTLLLLLLPVAVFSQKPIQPLLDSIEVFMEREKIPGLMLSIVSKDSILYTGGLGMANVEESEPVTAYHLFRIGSISKGFTSLGLLKLESEGRLSLETAITSIDATIPEGTWPISIENLLEHTAGYDDMHFRAVYNTEDLQEPPTSKLIKIHSTALQSRWKPSTRMSYSNPGYVMAGHIIEEVSGQPYANYLKEEILVPLGMTSSSYSFKEPESDLMTVGYRRRDGELEVQPYISIQGGPAGSMVSSAIDMAKFMQVILNKQENVIPANKYDRWENAETTLAAKAGLPGGYGLGNGNSYRFGYLFHGHNGGIEGFSSDYAYSREANLGVAVAINRMGRPGKIRDMVLRYFLEEGKPETDRKIQAIPTQMAEDYTGFYEDGSPRNQLLSPFESMWSGRDLRFEEHFAVTTDMLGEWTDTLFYAGNDMFYINDSGIPNAMLLKEEGKPILWMWSSYNEKSSKVKRLMKNIFFLLSVGICISFFIYALVWFIFSYLHNWRTNRGPRWILWFANLSLGSSLGLFIYSVSHLYEKGVFHTASVLLYLTSMVFLILAILGLRSAFLLKTENAFFRIYFLATSLSIGYLAYFFWVNGFIGFKLWSY